MAIPTKRPPGAVRRRIEFDGETWHALHQLSLNSMKSVQELAEEAFRDLLKKHRRPTTLKEIEGPLIHGGSTDYMTDVGAKARRGIGPPRPFPGTTRASDGGSVLTALPRAIA
jgi:hypothetical protein